MGKTMDRSCEDYSHIYRTFLKRGNAGLTDTEARALSIATDGTALVPTSWAEHVQETIAQDTLLGRVNIVHTASPFVLPIVTTDATVNTNVAEAAMGTESAVALSKPLQGLSGTTQYTFSLKKITAWIKVSNELLEDSEAAQSVEELLKRQLTAKIVTVLNKQILTGNGASGECQGSFQSAKLYSRTGSSTISNASLSVREMLYSMWLTSQAPWTSAVSYEMFNRSVLVLNSRQLSYSPTSTIYLAISPSAEGHLSILGRPLMYAHLEDTSPGAGTVAFHVFDPTQYLLAMNKSGISVARYGETFADTGQTVFAASVRADGSIMNSQAVFNVTNAS